MIKRVPTLGHLNPNSNQPSIYNRQYLLEQSRWIRDDLDPQVARDGPDALHSDDILTLDELLRRLLTSDLQLEDIRFSRLHLAIINIAGHATRWPKKLIEHAEVLREVWEEQYGNLRAYGTPLYETGGRLSGVCKPEDLSKDRLLIKWLKTPGMKPSPLVARRFGDLGFKSGECVAPSIHREMTCASVLTDSPSRWWISAVFAFKSGIIDSAETAGGVTCDTHCAYAVLLTNDEEVHSPSPEAFTYRARPTDAGRYRLTAATRESRQPIRVLRSHSLRSFWAPKAGVRYDGL